jgi:hypothetical protein
MSLAAGTLPTALDVLQARPLKRQPWTTFSKQLPLLSSPQNLLRTRLHYCAKVGSSLRSSHGCRTRVGVLVRDGAASSGKVSTVVDSEVIVLGLKADAVVAPVGNGAPGTQPSSLPGQFLGEDARGKNSSPLLVATDTLIVDALVPHPSEVPSELRVVGSVTSNPGAVAAQPIMDSAVPPPSLSSPIGSSPDVCSAADAGSSAPAFIYVVAQESTASSSLALAVSPDGTTSTAGSQPLTSLATPGGSVHAGSSQAAPGSQHPGPQPSHPPAEQQRPGLWVRLTGALHRAQWGKLWALTLLFISYVHQATTGFALPAMLPMISNELHLTDMQVSLGAGGEGGGAAGGVVTRLGCPSSGCRWGWRHAPVRRGRFPSGHAFCRRARKLAAVRSGLWSAPRSRILDET